MRYNADSAKKKSETAFIIVEEHEGASYEAPI